MKNQPLNPYLRIRESLLQGNVYPRVTEQMDLLAILHFFKYHEVYAKLIAQLVRHWVMIAIGWRCILDNIIKTAELVTLYARLITISFHKSKTALCRTLRDTKHSKKHNF